MSRQSRRGALLYRRLAGQRRATKAVISAAAPMTLLMRRRCALSCISVGSCGSDCTLRKADANSDQMAYDHAFALFSHYHQSIYSHLTTLVNPLKPELDTHRTPPTNEIARQTIITTIVPLSTSLAWYIIIFGLLITNVTAHLDIHHSSLDLGWPCYFPYTSAVELDAEEEETKAKALRA